ncbi:MAG: hypothetical protein GXY13_11385 [Acidimicrobiales bacterium]|nr:hypothetical protein [Acidimicrobiales bacterium]
MRDVRGAGRLVLVATALLWSGFVVGCGGDDGGSGADAAGVPAEDAGDGGDGGGGTVGGGGGGASLTVDGEAIDVGSPLCYLEPQDSAGGGGQILATAQVSGTNADGVRVALDFTRFDADSTFHGDDITLDVGELGDSVGFAASLDEGTIEVADGVVSGDDITLTEPGSGDSVVVSFDLDC